MISKTILTIALVLLSASVNAADTRLRGDAANPTEIDSSSRFLATSNLSPEQCQKLKNQLRKMFGIKM